ncbi:hypothetical protein HII31_02818 [Pseudocercospora fuligena]|uniref:Uncharacterized protein n=1 Tax=Pseudocercospora fuligena TaxID=685502 RepID=A0A8H6RT69_9PEZI|nr:hypothetical protein HII31_02818 [Pseudocercospora fuligena]
MVHSNHESKKNILTISLSKHLTGHPIRAVLEKDWSKPLANTAAEHFNNEGFDVDGNNTDKTIEDLRIGLHEREWDGALVGWCLRGYAERNEIFEQMMSATIEEIDAKRTKVLFCTGPDNLVEATLRAFPIT